MIKNYLTLFTFLVLVLTQQAIVAQNSRPTKSFKAHYPAYQFQIEKGVTNAREAAKLDSTLMQLKDMVMGSKTIAATNTVKVEVADIRVTYESIRYYLKMNGFVASEKYTLVE